MTGTVARIVRIKKVDAERHDGEGLRGGRKRAFLSHVFAAEAPEITAARGGSNHNQAEAVTCEAASRFSESSGQELAEKQNPVRLRCIPAIRYHRAS